MPINVSEEAAMRYTSNLNGKNSLFTPEFFDDSEIEEKNYKIGKQIYDDVKAMMGTYSIAVERDAQHITDIAWELIKADNEMLLDN